MSFLGRLGVVLALLAVVAFVAGCGGGTVIDQAKVQDEVKASLEHSQQAKVTSVQCPSGVEVEAGATFTCKVSISGGKTETATLKIRDSDANLSLIDLSPNE
ncbi:MAG TPA: DUF4333 domain-containing protein [Solirubrobacterales bacterium]|jgi:hypothetical protein|nr:DUF4333 domain-containing protein [Solirubrobacterales bacterium]